MNCTRHLEVIVFSIMVAVTMPAYGAKVSEKQSLHRADFRVVGANCPVCLRRIAKTLRTSKGVIEADVSIFRPYWSIIIYDAKQTDFQHITDSIKQEHVKLAELQDQSIAAVPAIIIPKGMTANQQATAAQLKDAVPSKAKK